MSVIPKSSLISYMSGLVKEKGGINLAQGIPGFEPPSELLELLRSATFKNTHQYAPGAGNNFLVEQIVRRYSKFTNLSRDNVLVTLGATEALSLLFFYLRENIKGRFSAASFSPAYEIYSQLPGICNIPFFELPYPKNDIFDAGNFEEVLKTNKTKIFFLASPGNPLGKNISKSVLTEITDICRKNKCYVIADFVYEDLHFGTNPYNPLEKLNPYLFYVNSFSKLLSVTGWRVGYVIYDDIHKEELRKMHDYTGLCAPSVFQIAIAEYLDKYNFGCQYTSEIRKKLRHSYEFLSEVLNQLNFEINQADGGYFIWCKLPNHFQNSFQTTLDFYQKTGVAVVPGLHFSELYVDYLRINIAFEEDFISKAAKLFRQYFVVKG